MAGINPQGSLIFFATAGDYGNYVDRGRGPGKASKYKSVRFCHACDGRGVVPVSVVETKIPDVPGAGRPCSLCQGKGYTNWP
jgi:DnaJ-class molecular chaperone